MTRKKVIKTISIIILILICISSDNTGNTIIDENNDAESLCGPNSLYFICRQFNKFSSIEELCSLSGYSETNGTTMLGLYKAALEKELPVVPIETNIEQLCSINSLCIAFVDGNHFMVVIECKGNKVIVQNPPEKPFSVLKEDFQRRWNGELLVFSEKLKSNILTREKQSKQLENGPYIQFNETDYDFGVVEEGSKLSHKFIFSNIGSDTLIVSARSTCSCTATLLSKKIIPPMDNGEILLEYNTTGKKGHIYQDIDVMTNNTDQKWIKLSIQATIENKLKVIPEKLWLGEISKNEVVYRKLHIVNPGGNSNIIKIETPEGVEAELMAEEEDINGRKSIPINLSINSGLERGEMNKHLIIHTADLDKDKIIVPISAKVLSDIKAIPPSIFIGDVDSNEIVEREIKLVLTNSNDVKNIKTITNAPYISTEIRKSTINSDYLLVVTLQSPIKEMTIQNKIQVYVNNNESPSLEIPIFARIGDKHIK